MRRHYWKLVLGLALVTTACADISRVSDTQFQGEYHATLVDYAAGGRDLHTVVVGDPFGEGALFAQRVTAILTERHVRDHTNFTAEPGPSARLQYKLVLFFNPARSVTPNALCRDPDALESRSATTQEVELQMAFCNDVVAMTYLRGPVADGTRTARFESLLSMMLHLLLPTEAPHRFCKVDS